jgi:hypothetical protein
MSLFEKLIGAFAGAEQELPTNAILIDVRSVGEYQPDTSLVLFLCHWVRSVTGFTALYQTRDARHRVLPVGCPFCFCKKYAVGHGYTNVVNGGGVGGLAIRFTKTNLPFLIHHDDTNDSPPIQQS